MHALHEHGQQQEPRGKVCVGMYMHACTHVHTHPQELRNAQPSCQAPDIPPCLSPSGAPRITPGLWPPPMTSPSYDL